MLKTIRLTPEDVKHFVDVASKCDFDIDICYNRYVVDAKSFLGVYGLDFTKPLTVSYDGYNDKFEEMLKQCAIACLCTDRSVFLNNRMSFDYPGKIEYYLPG